MRIELFLRHAARMLTAIARIGLAAFRPVAPARRFFVEGRGALWVPIVSLALLLGCRRPPRPASQAVESGSPASSSLNGSSLELYSWWSSSAEVAARQALVDRFQRETGAAVKTRAPSDRGAAQKELLARFAAGAPPDATQASAGSRLRRWVQGRTPDSNESWLQPLGFMQAHSSRFPPEVLDLVSLSGEAYAVPLNVHRLNTVFFNREVLGTAGLAFPTGWDQLLTHCERLRARAPESRVPAELACLGFSATPWIAESFLRNLVLAESGQPNKAARWWRELAAGGNAALAACRSTPDPVLGGAFRRLAELAPHFNGDWAASPSWDELAARLGRGNLAFFAHPDWAHGALLRKGHEPGRHYGVAAAPGTAGLFVFSMDTFALPTQAPRNPTALAWLERLATPPYQQDFNRIKGSVPARLDVDMSAFDSVTQAAQRDFSRSGTVRLPALQLLVARAGFADALGVAAAQVAATGDTQAAWESLCVPYATLATPGSVRLSARRGR